MKRQGARPSAPGIVARGCLMGAADIVPGVSGGTMALVTGIYGRLIAALSHIPEAAVMLARERHPLVAMHRMDAGFLLLLLAGIVTSVIGLAHVVDHLLTHHELLIRGFFFGLVLGAVAQVGRQVPRWSLPVLLALGFGTFMAWGMTRLTPAEPILTLPLAYGAGFVAISAMILPGISGSFILLLMGVYQPMLAAIRAADLLTLGTFAFGSVCGLVAMARAIAATLRRFPGPTLAALTGFMLGSLGALWPWQAQVSGGSGHDNLGPLGYAQSTGTPHEASMVMVMLVLGALLVMLIERLTGDGNEPITL